jgi:hypothetical protein
LSGIIWCTDNAREPLTSEKGPSWYSVSPLVFQHDGHPARISAIALSNVGANVPNSLWIGYEDGQIYNAEYRLEPSNYPSWVRCDVDRSSGNQILPRRFRTCIAVDPTDSCFAYVTFGGYRNDNVWKTSDHGQHWSNISGEIAKVRVPVNAIAVHPKTPNFLYAGTGVGVFLSRDGGRSWSPTKDSPTTCSVVDLSWMGDTLLVATHGRGVFAIQPLASPR